MARDNAELVFCALGGTGEIGMNMALYGYGPAAKRRFASGSYSDVCPNPDFYPSETIFLSTFQEKLKTCLVVI